MALERHPDELVADFQQHYGIRLRDVDALPDSERAWVALLAAQLPRGSRVASAMDERAEWSDETYLLRAIEYEMRLLLWGMSDPKRRGEKPQPIMSLAEQREKERLVKHAEAVESAVAAAFNIFD